MSSRARELLTEIDWAHARLISPANYAQTAKRLGRYTAAPHNEIANIYKEYEQLKVQRNTLDLDDLIARVIEAMRADNAYAQAVRWRYRHIFVDEAQDMNPLQYELFEAIRGQRADVFIVGDPMQAIYGWNGSEKVIRRIARQDSRHNSFAPAKQLSLHSTNSVGRNIGSKNRG